MDPKCKFVLKKLVYYNLSEPEYILRFLLNYGLDACKKYTENGIIEQTIYTYDANGNQITKTSDGKTETNTYDGLNQLIGFTDGETEASYTYFADGLRASKTVDGQTTKHIWDSNKQIIVDVVVGDNYEATCYVRGTNLLSTYHYWYGERQNTTYYLQNAHGDVINLSGTDGELTKTYKYDAFGVEKYDEFLQIVNSHLIKKFPSEGRKKIYYNRKKKKKR